MILGVDCSTKAIAVFGIAEHKGLTWMITSPAEDAFERTKEMFKQMVTLIECLDPEMVMVENSPYLQNIKVTLQIHAVVDAVRFACVLGDIPVQTIEVPSWKKDILGNGHADKPEIMQFAKAKWGEALITNQDLADASCIAMYLQRRMER